MTSTTDLPNLNTTNLTSISLNTSSPNNSNDSSHNLSTTSSNSNASITLNKVLETQPKSTDSGIGSEKSWYLSLFFCNKLLFR